MVEIMKFNVQQRSDLYILNDPQGRWTDWNKFYVVLEKISLYTLPEQQYDVSNCHDIINNFNQVMDSIRTLTLYQQAF